MRIAYICADPGISPCGHKGASVHLRSFAAALATRGNHVEVICRRMDGPNPPPERAQITLLPKEPAGQTDALRRRLLDAPVDAVLERYSLESGPALQVTGELGIPYLLEVNAPLVEEAVRFRALANGEHWQTRERELFRSADRILAVSQGVRDHVLRCGVDAGRVTVVHNGVDLARFQAAAGTAVRQRHKLVEPVIGFTGSLKQWHGVDDLLRAFSGLSGRPTLLVVGDGPERKRLQELAVSRGLGTRAFFVGAVEHAEVPEYLAAMQIGVAPYARMENFYFSPLKVAEYLAAGLPVVATDQGDIQDLVADGGLLVPPGDIEALRRALASLCEDTDLRQRLGEAGRRRAASLTWDSVAARVEGLLAAAVGAL